MNMETYRSGHNGTDSKSVEPQGSVGSNPTVSAIKAAGKQAAFIFLGGIGGMYGRGSRIVGAN